MSIEVGYTYTDRITGYTGVCIGFVEYITGCNQALLQAKSENGNVIVEPHWFDVQRLQLIGEPKLTLDNGSTPGFAKAAPKI